LLLSEVRGPLLWRKHSIAKREQGSTPESRSRTQGRHAVCTGAYQQAVKARFAGRSSSSAAEARWITGK
jgi:hypothetical protein